MTVLMKLTDMAEPDMHFIEMWAQGFAAVGTVGALVAALVVFRHEYVERRRGDVRGVRSWVEINDEGEAGSQTREKVLRPKGYIRNTSPEAIYDIKYTFKPVSVIGAHVSGSAEYLLPDEQDSMECIGVPRHRTAFEYPRLDVVFTDSRGTRWNRQPSGVLKVVKPFNRPWRIPHELDFADLPLWAVRAHWHYRIKTHAYRRSFGLAPKWWAVDLRWARWRYAQKHDKIKVPWWRPIRRWKGRHEIARRRIGQDLPLPLWILDYRYWQKYELSAREEAIRAMHAVNLTANGPDESGG
ncbi:hypothetical protein [Arthrobacter sp. ISL-69]|uniref:hypothetical protein n=1 Tax=Arthrobacter sp. ISL-69 TaxID=2819113 RepID=UPI001BEB2223|nr:hypothetical protein [Arthrobacter sp. ISL-69]MBT2538781.1 hypothetical protein [Arthrobacter sp. ISL-69]